MEEWSRFELTGHTFIASLPANDQEAQVFTISVLKDGTEIRRETVPLLYRPIYGPDAGDVVTLNVKVEEIIAELGLE